MLKNLAGRNSAGQAKEKVETLVHTLAKVKAKVLADTHSEKLTGRVTDLKNTMGNV